MNKFLKVFILPILAATCFVTCIASAADDVTPPVITELSSTQGELDTSGVPVLRFAATDEGSGMDHFEASFAFGNFIKVENPYPLDQITAKREITLRAFDKAGNYAEKSLNYSPPALGGTATGDSGAGGRRDGSPFRAIILIILGFGLWYLVSYIRRIHKFA